MGEAGVRNERREGENKTWWKDAAAAAEMEPPLGGMMMIVENACRAGSLSMEFTAF